MRRPSLSSQTHRRVWRCIAVLMARLRRSFHQIFVFTHKSNDECAAVFSGVTIVLRQTPRSATVSPSAAVQSKTYGLLDLQDTAVCCSGKSERERYYNKINSKWNFLLRMSVAYNQREAHWSLQKKTVLKLVGSPFFLGPQIGLIHPVKHVEPMCVWCWTSIADGGPASNQHCVYVSWFVGHGGLCSTRQKPQPFITRWFIGLPECPVWIFMWLNSFPVSWSTNPSFILYKMTSFLQLY